MLYTCTQIFLQNFFEIEQISLETLFKYFSEPPCTQRKRGREKNQGERRQEREGGEVEKWDKGRFLRSLVERQLDRGKGEPLVTGFRRYTVMQYALGLPLDVVGLKKTPGVDGEKDHDAHEGGGSVRQEAQQPSCRFRHFSRAM